MAITGFFKKKQAPPPPSTPAMVEKSGPPTFHELMTPRSTDAQSLRSTRGKTGVTHELMVIDIFEKQMKRMWIGDDSGEVEGAIVKKSRGEYVSFPPRLVTSTFGTACAEMNLQCAITVNSRVIKTYLMFVPNAYDIPLDNGLFVQVIPTMEDLPKARKAQFAAVIASTGLLVVWDDDPKNLISRAKHIESELMELAWDQEVTQEKESKSDIKAPKVVVRTIDEETGEFAPEDRPLHLMNCIYVSIVLFIIIALLGTGFRQIALEVKGDGDYIRVSLLLLIPVNVFFTLFFIQVVVGCVAQMIGPIRQMSLNSKYYSAMLPQRLTHSLPHITIQCPVYKEGLASVIIPTVRSIKQAICTYELQGGSANIFINDDGLQLLDEEERQARLDFYNDNNIGWTARPPHNSDGFIRKGKFKKASNMNFGLMLSCRVEEKLAEIVRPQGWNQDQEAEAYSRCLLEVLDDHGRAWADGNIRVGDYILLIDSDTRVPEDCLLDAASEMEQSPEVGIMQFSSGVMQVVNTYFENGITFFTNLIYTAIRYTVSNGDVAPFVGHNAILRWSAIQEVSYMDEDNYEKFWSESHVSEDFDMSLRLQCNGYIIRLAAWAGEGFKEGVSLTVYDELARWEKYAYGCNELLFNPLRQWIYRGPFTPLFRRFLFSNIRFTSKVTIISYIGTYYAIGAAWILTTVNYFAIGWFNGELDRYYIQSFNVWISLVVVFNILGNVALAVMRYRIGERSFFGALLENFKWLLMLAIFLGGLSLHVSQALLAHMFEINMTWGATGKEAEFSNFWIEVPRVLKNFKYSLAFSIFGIGTMIVLSVGDNLIPDGYGITSLTAILPMATLCGSHFLLPIALNPALMTFSF